MKIDFDNRMQLTGLRPQSVVPTLPQHVPDRRKTDNLSKESIPETGDAGISRQGAVQRGHQAPQEAAQLLRPFSPFTSDPADFDAVHTGVMAQAISDMQKDDVLREYQYFVGSANYTGAGTSEVAYQDGDGLVRRLS